MRRAQPSVRFRHRYFQAYAPLLLGGESLSSGARLLSTVSSPDKDGLVVGGRIAVFLIPQSGLWSTWSRTTSSWLLVNTSPSIFPFTDAPYISIISHYESPKRSFLGHPLAATHYRSSMPTPLCQNLSANQCRGCWIA
jgi:hypothetical protein